MSIAAIETHYAGHRFRSRLEARYAVFFDNLQVKWEYEPEGYLINGVPYLPDFWLPKYSLFVEVKGSEPTDAEVTLCEALCRESRRAVVISRGLPTENCCDLYAFGDSGACGNVLWRAWDICGDGPGISLRGCKDTMESEILYAAPDVMIPVSLSLLIRPGTRMHQAALAAKRARFEYGEKG